MRFVYYCRRYPNSNYSKKDIDYDIKHPSNSTCFNRLRTKEKKGKLKIKN